jgi:hypothetical protein
MLKAILEGKAGRIAIDNSVPQSWREVFRLREDLLTAVFFSRLRYLSAEGERKVLALLIGEESAAVLGELKEISFWPQLSVTDLDSRSFVEPDVLIICENAALLIEVKPPFGGIQSLAQWRNEIASLIQQKNNDTEWDIPDTIHFVALGRNASDWKKQAVELEIYYAEYDLQVHALEWESVNHAVAELLDKEDGRDRAIYGDWLDAFALFGLIDRPQPFASLLPLIGKVSTNWSQFFRLYPTAVKKRLNNGEDWSSLIKFSNKMKLDIGLWK